MFNNQLFFNRHISDIQLQLQNIELSPTELSNTIELFKKNHRVIFCTIGKPMFTCGKIIHSARSFGLDYHELNVTIAGHGDLGIVIGTELLVFVSKSGETHESCDLARYIHDVLGYVNTLSITSSKSTLSSICTNNLIIPIITEGAPLGVDAPFISTMLYMAVLHGILIEAIEASDISTRELFARNHPAGLIGANLQDHAKKS